MKPSPEVVKFIRWYDKKTFHSRSFDELVFELATLRKVPPSMVEGFAKFKKRNKKARKSLVITVAIDY